MAAFGDPGGRPPLGFARVGEHKLLEPVEGPDLDLVRRLFALYATGGHSDYSLALETGLSEFRIEEILTNPLYAGRAVRHKGRPDEEERQARFPAPVDPALFERVQECGAVVAPARAVGPASAGAYPIVRLMRCAVCGSPYRGDASAGKRRVRHIHRPACSPSYTHHAHLFEDQVAELLDKIELDEADIGDILRAVRRAQPVQAEPDTVERTEARRELQRRWNAAP